MATVGKIIQNKRGKYVEWHINDFSSLSMDDGYYFYSPDMEFGSRLWSLWMFPNGDSRIGTQDRIEVHLVRISCGLPISVRFFLALKTTDGSIYAEEHFTHIFMRCNDRSGSYKLSKRSEVHARMMEIIPDDVLRVVCKFKFLNEVASEGCTCVPRSSKDAFLHDFKELFLKQEDCDIVIRVRGEEFSAHKAILRARAPALLASLRDKKKKEVVFLDVEDVEASSFKGFLYFLYSGEVEGLSTENVFSLFNAAVNYNVPDLREKCLEFISVNLSIDTFFDVLDVARRIPENELMSLVSDFFARNAPKVIESDKWLSFQTQNAAVSNELFIGALAFAQRSNVFLANREII